MRRSTVVLGCIFILMAACAGLFLMGGTLSARVNAITASAADYPRAYAAIADAMRTGAAPQTFAAGLPDDPADCRLEDVTVTLSNRGLFDAEWISVSVDGAPGDIAVYSVSGEGGSVRARSSGTLNLKLVSADDDPAGRVYRIQYYVYGMKRSIAVSAS